MQEPLWLSVACIQCFRCSYNILILDLWTQYMGHSLESSIIIVGFMEHPLESSIIIKMPEIMNSMKLVILLHSLYWSIHTKDESKRGTAVAFIFGVN